MISQRIVPVQLLDYYRSKGIEVLLLQEILVEGEEKIYGFYEGQKVIFAKEKKKAKAAIVILSRELEMVVVRGETDRYIAVATVRKGRGKPSLFISAYFKCDVRVNLFTNRLGEILDRVGEDVVIGADVNAHSEL